jgi:hypothetical protein
MMGDKRDGRGGGRGRRDRTKDGEGRREGGGEWKGTDVRQSEVGNESDEETTGSKTRVEEGGRWCRARE